MNRGMTSYVAIAAVLFCGGSALAYLVHPAWSTIPAAVMALAAYSLVEPSKKPQASPIPEGGREQSNDGERILVPVKFKNTAYNFYFDSRGKILHLSSGSNENDLASIGFYLARIWSRAPIQLMEHVGRRMDFKIASMDISFLPVTPISPPCVTFKVKGSLFTMEEGLFMKFFCACGTAFAAAWGHYQWPDNVAIRETTAAFLLAESCRESSRDIRRVAEYAESPIKDMELLAQASPEEKERIFSRIEASVMVPLLRATPADISWNCIRDLPLKVRLLLADDVVHSPFPPDHEWRRALEIYREKIS